MGRYGSYLKPCKRCKRLFPYDQLSNQGYCKECAVKALEEALEQMQKKEGKVYQKWLKRWVRGTLRYAEKRVIR